MEAIKSVSDYKRFLEKNRDKLSSNAIKADQISHKDEWMQDTVWDDIYRKEVKDERIQHR